MTPRNKLVKRSTSQRVLHSGSFGGSPFGTPSSTSTFRRPATSHQRSEHQRYQNLQRDFANSSRLLETSYEQDHGLESSLVETSTPNSACKPFFVSKIVTHNRDTSPKGELGLKSPALDSIRCVVRSKAVPILVSASSIQSRPRSSFQNEVRPEQKYRSRNSFSLGGFLPSASPTWRIGRSGNTKKGKSSQSSTMGHRVVSAPLQGSPNAPGKKVPEEFVDGGGTLHKQRSRNVSSPLPSLRPLSNFDINLPDDDPSLPNSPRLNQPSSPFSQASPFSSSPSNILGLVSGRLRYPHRESRVPSDQDSTTFGSENEHSRVFSIDGDDTDGRSETVYDSIRTGGTGSSHSGARGQRIENIFGDVTPPDLAKHNLSALQEQLSGVVMSRPSELDSFIAEEEESVKTPQPHSNTFTHSTPHPSLETGTPAAEEKAAREVFDEWSLEDRESEDDLWSTEDVEVPPAHAATSTQRRFLLSSRVGDASIQANLKNSERPKSNIFEWSERQPTEKDSQTGSSPRPRTAHARQLLERGGRSSGRWTTNSGQHLRSQSVPLPPEKPNQRFNALPKLEGWMLGGKPVSEEWDNDFVFDESSITAGSESNGEKAKAQSHTSSGVVVPRSIMERQATVHGQFGQVKELTLLVEELRRLHHSAQSYGILNGQASELWKEAEGIIDLASLDDDEPTYFASHSPKSASFDFESFEEELPSLHQRKVSTTTPPRAEAQHSQSNNVSNQPVSQSSPAGTNKLDTSSNRTRSDSVAKAKHVLENIHQHRTILEPKSNASATVPKKLPFDTTSLRDLVTRAGVVTRALKEIIRRIEDPGNAASTPEKRPGTPPDPLFSHIFQQSSSPSSTKRSPRMPTMKGNGNLMNSSMTANDNELNAHVKIMTVV